MWLNNLFTGFNELGKLLTKKNYNQQKVYEAVEAINKAANRTSIYITKSINGTYKSSQELSDMWMEAATTVRSLDVGLYDRLLGKAEYWSNPEEWPEERILKARISLLEIKREAKKLLENRPAAKPGSKKKKGDLTVTFG